MEIFGIIGIICAIVLVLCIIIFIFGDNGQGGNDWIEIFKLIKEKINK